MQMFNFILQLRFKNCQGRTQYYGSSTKDVRKEASFLTPTSPVYFVRMPLRPPPPSFPPVDVKFTDNSLLLPEECHAGPSRG